MEILSVTLKNFKAHPDRHFIFQPGTNAICGENGAGKTSILEAIAWVLFDYKGDYKTEDFIRNGTSAAQVTVAFVSSRDQRTYEVQRHTRSGYTLFDPQLNEKLPYTRIKEEVVPWLRQQLDVSPGTDLADLFGSTIGVPQGTFTADFQLPPEQRKRVFDKVLKVEEYQKIWKDWSALEKYSKAQIEAIERDLSQYHETLQEWDTLITRRDQLRQDLTQVVADLAHWQHQLHQLQAAQQRINTHAAQLQQLNQQLIQHTTQRHSHQQRLEQLHTDLEQAQQSVTICSARRDAYQLVLQANQTLQALEQQRSQQQTLQQQRQTLMQQLSQHMAQEATIAHQLERAQRAQTELISLTPKIQQQTELEQQLQALQQHLHSLRATQQTLQRDATRRDHLNQRQQHLAHAIAQLEPLEATIAQIPQLEAQQQRYQQQLSRIAAAAQFEVELRQIATQAQTRSTLHQRDVEVATTSLKELQAATPLWNSQIEAILTTLQTSSRLYGHLLSDLQAILDDLAEQVLAERLQQQLQQTQTQLDHLRQQQAQYLSLDAKRQEQQHLLAEIAELHAQIQHAQTQLAAATDLDQQVAQVQAQLSALEDPRSRRRFLQQELEQEGNLPQQQLQLQSALAQIQAAIAQLDTELAAFAQLNEQITAQHRLREQHDADYTLYLEHQQSANRCKPLKQQYAEAYAQFQTLEQHIAILEAQQAELTAQIDPQWVAQIQTDYQQAQHHTISLQAQLPEKQKHLEELERQLAKLQTIREKQDAAQVTLKHKQTLDRWIKFARKAYKQAGPRITASYVQSIAREADKLVRELLNRPNLALEWTQDYEILVREGPHARRFINLSGGEQMCAALAVRLALLKVLADLDVAFFDEPTTNMDRPRRIQLAAAIANIKTFRQLFVISHDDTFEQVTENVIFVERMT